MLASILGYESNQELVDSVMHIGDQLYADPAERIKFEQILAEQEQIEDFECLLQRKDGTQFWSNSSAHMIQDERVIPPISKERWSTSASGWKREGATRSGSS